MRLTFLTLPVTERALYFEQAAFRRFSEDIDLSMAPAYLGISEDEAAGIASRTQREA